VTAEIAEVLAVRFGTPGWSQIETGAGRLAAAFDLPNPRALAEAVVEGLGKGKVVGGEIVQGQVNGRVCLLDQDVIDFLEYMLELGLMFHALLEKVGQEDSFAFLDQDKARALRAGSAEFLASIAFAPSFEPERDSIGRKSKRIGEAGGFPSCPGRRMGEAKAPAATRLPRPGDEGTPGRLLALRRRGVPRVRFRPACHQNLAEWLKNYLPPRLPEYGDEPVSTGT
jgi:hypothetical protein